ncbi:hypothetical protein [Candidatus Thiosymbion oneisti]|uniref:hypothetical protein n=1 Tax=Candidatus Thiosymbion oneisti TaxID=589554 RepID=UPI00105B4818|nr:hypothetical protein [Candidatus Thiosymbion oneisti]
MKLVITALPQLARERNVIMSVPSSFDWILPEDGRFGQRDFFAVSALLAAADTRREGEPPRDPMACLRAIGNQLKQQTDGNPDAFFQTFANAVLGPVVNSLRVQYHGLADYEAGTPDWYRALANEGRAIDFEAQDDNSTFQVEFKIALPSETSDQCGADPQDTVSVFDRSGDPFQTRDPIEFKDLDSTPEYPNVWLGRHESHTGPYGPYAPRTLLSVEVPVTLYDWPGHWYVPFYFSVADLERQLGIEVGGIARQGAYFPDANLVGAQEPDLEKARPDPDADSRFTVWFDRPGLKGFVDRSLLTFILGFKGFFGRPLLISASEKERIIVGADDVIFWRVARD